ncbi:hypothetical protein AMECASPLE_039492 [Ameca splendens]|uniref:Uncharacterized protein n=1 Tax=Ameca splendens TaxID=208324 RepID=A0ABV0XLJ5_9TELE
MPCMLGEEQKKEILTDSSVRDALDETYKKRLMRITSTLKLLLKLLLTAVQNLPLRGHLEADTPQNKGNFLDIMELISQLNPLIAKKEMQNIPVTQFMKCSVRNIWTNQISDV